MTTFAERLTALRDAGYPLVWATTVEPERLLTEAVPAINEHAPVILAWDCDRGLLDLKSQPSAILDESAKGNPGAALTCLLGQPQGAALFIHMAHRVVDRPPFLQQVRNMLRHLETEAKTVIFLAVGTDGIPREINRDVTIVEHKLPDKPSLEQTVREIAETSELPAPPDDEMDAILSAGMGLTLMEFKNAACLATALTGRFDPAAINEQKMEQLKKNPALELLKFERGFESLCGLSALKAVARKSVRSLMGSGSKAKPKGVLLLGPPGVGKSHFAKAMGAETGVPVILFKVGRLMGSRVGESEANLHHILQVFDSIGVCIVFVDEIEKAFSGMASSHQSDGGTFARVGGSWLTWMQDHESPVYLVGSCNDITKLPPEFSRAGRWDGLYYVDLPDRDARKEIWDLYKTQYEVDGDTPLDDGWTGAEIRQCCINSCLFECDLVAASDFIVPTSVSMREEVDKLRNFASSRCIDANLGGRYQVRRETSGPSNGRRIRGRG